MSTIPARADVVVIGGGPAGSTAANLLAQRGYDVVLLEKVKHPRVVVGESLLPHFWKYADDLGATGDIERADFIKKSGGTAIWRGRIRQVKIADFGHTRPPLHVERDEFDHVLLTVARNKGVRVFEEVVVVQALLDQSRIVGVRYAAAGAADRGELRCQYVIDASGQGAVLANQLGFREFDRDLRFFSVWGYFENSAYVAQGGQIHPWSSRRAVRPTTLQAGIGEWGWCWHIPLKNSTSVGLVLAPSQQAEFKTSGKTLADRFVAGCRRVPYVRDLLAEATLIPDSLYGIRDFAYRPNQLAGDGWYVVGDAAAFVDPINSAGVLTAFYTGSLAALSVDSSLRNQARAGYYTHLYSTLVRQRLSLFRISALPEGHNSYRDDYQWALRAATMDSVAEQELLMVQTFITDRPQNLAPLLAMDRTLKYDASEKFTEYGELRPIMTSVAPA